MRPNEPLCRHARFGIGGPCLALVDAAEQDAFLEALTLARESGLPFAILGGGTNLIVAGEGFPGLVLRYRDTRITASNGGVQCGAGADLQTLVDFTIDKGLAGLHTMTGIPGWVGGALYGNAGAYGHSIMESVARVRYLDGERVRTIDNAGCEFRYRESAFKRNKHWIVLSAELEMPRGEPITLRAQASQIQTIRDEKYPPAMRCAGSIFKNCIFTELPAAVAAQLPETMVREGKVPSAWFLEQVGAKGMRRGDIQVAHYHANLIYNDGEGRSADVCAIIDELKRRVQDRFGLTLEEEVQYVGFPDR